MILFKNDNGNKESKERHLNSGKSKEMSQFLYMIWATGNFDGAKIEVLIKPEEADEFIVDSQAYYMPFYAPVNAVGNITLKLRLSDVGANTDITAGIQ